MARYYLIHSGTKGMRWGQRLYQYKDGSLTPLGRLRYGKSSKTKSSKTKSLSNLTDEELKKQTNRLIAENNYYKAETEWKKYTNPTSPIRKLTGEILTASVKNIGTQAATYALGTAVNNLAGKEIVDPYKGGLGNKKDKKDKKDD